MAVPAPADSPGSKLGLWWWGARTLVRHGRPEVALAFLGGLGDELLCTAPLAEWLARGARRVWVRTRRPELFEGLGPRARILRDDPRLDRLALRLREPFRYLAYSQYEPARDRDSPPESHIIVEMCRRAGLAGEIRLRPHWTLAAAERAASSRWHEHLAIQTSTLDAHVPMLNKQWPADRFQAVVDHFAGTARFVHIGSPHDPPLRGVTDLRGATAIRETAAVLHGARGFIGPVGFLMHLARAVDCPAAIVYGGRETPALTGYSCNENVTRAPACSPCWQRSRCDFDRMCLRDLPASEVIAAVARLLARPRGPLAVDTAMLGSPPSS